VRQAGGTRPGGPGTAKHTADRAGARYREDGPVRQGSLREHNLALVLRHVAASPRPVSRAWIARATGLTRATVSALVDDLIGGRLLTEVEPAPRAGAGRPANGLTLAIDGPAGLGLEVNVDYLAACVVDLSGDVRLRLTQPGDQRPRTPDEVFADLAGLAAKARDGAVADGLRLAGAAVAVPGLVDPEGVVRLAPNLGWRDVPVPAALALLDNLADFAVPLRVDNEANLAALGELHAAPPGRPSFVYVSGEIGIGAGIVLDGALFRGARGWSGELGHMTVDRNGPPCHCGSRGCLERYAGQEVLLAATADGDADRLAELAAAGDRGTLRALTGAATALGVTLAGVVNLLDVDTVVLGGVYAPLAPWLGPTVQKELRGRVLTAQWSPVTVRPSVLGGGAAVVGAAGSVVRSVLDQPTRWLS
jgi:predicted NBD/HSP70 family sugar kinase